MQIFRLVPYRSGSHWSLARNHGEIVVRARTSGEARIVAAMAEAEATGAGDETRIKTSASAFRNPLLYGVRRDRSGRYPAKGGPEMLEGGFVRDLA